ncbi:ABC transporter substrate-binding protein [Actinomadura sp. HBU206391]|uniref:ABC transporter substrate-binding protein n=1 Tax=Actinomadura sp. HBU206391 TaxID=2731692 RepID=UPI00164F517E|nr:extracellular solute-binding protein [Actinomadura sp. HBU206391]MBC6457844.1 extracellular solute-binding protein [Actinomadura sp. HBU206391]
MKSRKLTILLVTGIALTAAGCGGDDGDGDSGAGSTPGQVSVTVACQPPKTAKEERRLWDEDVVAFEKLHPNIKVVSKDAFPCYEPKTFEAKLAGGQLEDVFYVNFPNVSRIIQAGQATDISSYVGALKNGKDLRPDVTNIFKSGGKTYGVPRDGYGMGLVYNRKLFTKAGLDPNNPPKTWAEVREAAKKIAGLGSGYVGFGEYSGGNTGGWHFTASLYGRGGDAVTPDGTKAAFNSDQGKAVLQTLKDMRWTDNSMGTRRAIKWEDLMQQMAGGRMGMMLGAPDVTRDLQDKFRGKIEDFGVTAQPEATAALNGGSGYMFNRKASPEKIKAGLLWLEYQYLTPGKGQFDYPRLKAVGRPVGLPIPDLYGTTPPGQQIAADRKQNATVPVENFAPYAAGTANIAAKPEPPLAQEIYAVLDTPMSAVLTRQDADINKLLSDAEKKVNALLAKS